MSLDRAVDQLILHVVHMNLQIVDYLDMVVIADAVADAKVNIFNV
jgi:hypothetical protein